MSSKEETKVSWTREQLAAINTRGANLLVAAAAGSGKTAVLVERIIKMITDRDNPIDIDRLLVVTFTNAAASEMRERIGEAISKEIHKSPNSKTLQRQLTLLNKASITTIHSFCLEVIKTNFHMIDLDPSFRVADETEAILLKQEALDEVFDEMYDRDDKLFLKLVECYCNNKNDSQLFDMVLNLYNFAMSSPSPIEWLKEKSDVFNVSDSFSFQDSKLGQALLKDVRIELESIVSSMNIAREIVNNTPSLLSYQENINPEYEMIKRLYESSNSFEDLKDSFENVSFGKLTTIRGCKDKIEQEEVKKIRDNAKKKIGELSNIIIQASSKRSIEDLKYLYPLMDKLSELVVKMKEAYDKKKKERALIDFNDFEHFALDILTEKNDEGQIIPSKVAEELREKYEEILIDEYQDSNYVQEYILTMISRNPLGENNIFMVGDVKQSIYRFRMAKPELFLHKKNTYSEEEDADEIIIKLYKNFRSREEVINATNFIFKHIMSSNLGELEYTEEEALNLGADYKPLEDDGIVGGPVEIMLFEKNKDIEEIEEEDSEPLTNIQIEARAVGNRIKELTNIESDFKVFDKNTKNYRNVEYKDVVILLRATSEYAPVFSEELKNLGIPVYADTSEGYFNTLEIQIMISLLQIIDNPRQDIPLLAVLRSPIGGFSAENLVDIRINSPETTVYEAMNSYLNEEEDLELKKKVEKFLEKLVYWRNKALITPIDEFIWYLYMDTGYYGYVGAMPAGIQRQANLRILFQRARQYENTSYKGLFNFVNFINKLKVSSGDLGTAKTIGENENVVRIMSIHKSKGLEFPIVFLSAMGKNFNRMDSRKKVLFHHDLGFGPELVDVEKRISYSPTIKEILKSKINIESLSEEMRVLYVAFTRAKEKLILTGTCRDFDKSIENWTSMARNSEDKILEGYLLKGNSYLDWVMPCVIKHKDGEPLRNYLKINEESVRLVQDNSKWSIKLMNYKDLDIEGGIAKLEAIDIKEKLKEIELKEINIHYRQEIEKRLNFKYKYEASTKIPTVLTVSELKRTYNQNLNDEFANTTYIPAIVRKPAFLEEKRGLTPSEKGIAMHSVMQRLDIDSINSKKDIISQIENMVIKELITEEQAKSIRVEKILKFFNTNLGERILIAHNKTRVYKETPFSIEISSTEIDEGLDKKIYEKENIIVQGIIDGYFEEDGEIVLFDYKTDYVPNGDTASIVEKYRVQIDYYTRALEKILGKKVKERYLYLFSIDSEVIL